MAVPDLQSPNPSAVKASRGAVSARYKRPFDLAVLALVVPVAIRLDSPGPVLYRQPRLGRGGKVFGIVKLRTMRRGAEAGTGPVLARPGDPRLTAVGRVLRRWHVDELPQAWNILRGQMSLVGPRPERPELAARFAREVPGFSRRLATRPGVMGLVQWRGGYRAGDLSWRHSQRLTSPKRGVVPGAPVGRRIWRPTSASTDPDRDITTLR